MTEKPLGPDGLWEICASMEALAGRHAAAELGELERAFKLAYESGVQAPTVPSGRHAEADMRVASLFLKRTLNDLRATWVLLRSGYTSQAAAVAASLWENSMAVACVAGHPDRAKATTGHPGGELPWAPKKLAQLLAADQVAPVTGGVASGDVYELRWREHYGPYKWFCKIKHPTLTSASHDAFSARKDDDTYVVMAIPDLRPEDLGMKLAVGTASLNRTLSGIRAFVSAAECPQDSDQYRNWAIRWKEASELTIGIMTHGRRPVLTLAEDTGVMREYQGLRNRLAPPSSDPPA